MPDPKDDVTPPATAATSLSASRSWLTLPNEELSAIVETNEAPADIDWESIVEHAEFERLFRMREHPAKIAQFLLNERAVTPGKKTKREITYKPALSIEYRMQRLALKQEEVRVQKERVKNASVLFDRVVTIDDRLKRVEKALDTSLKLIVELLREIELRVRPGSRR